MKTLSFIGSDKNAGKTTALNYVYKTLLNRDVGPICLTSIGLNGEEKDNYEGDKKPSITIYSGSYFVTHIKHLRGIAGRYEIINVFGQPTFNEKYVLGKAKLTLSVILEGPNDKKDLILLKGELKKFHRSMLLLIDGSIDRQFLAHPKISDYFYFSLLISSRLQQIKKAKDLINAQNYAAASVHDQRLIEKFLEEKTNTQKEIKSLLICNDEIIYSSSLIPFMDDELKKILLKDPKQKLKFFLNGALTRSLHTFLAPFKNLTLILDNFTLFQNIVMDDREAGRKFYPHIYVKNAVKVKTIFIKEDNLESNLHEFNLPVNTPKINLFREDIDEITF